MGLTSEVRVGVISLAGLLAIALVFVFVAGKRVGRKGYPIEAVFHQVQGLPVGAEVRLAGVAVGEVTEVGLANSHLALVSIRMKGDVTLYPEYAFVIKRGALIGEPYIEIEPVPEPKGEPLAAGSRVVGHDPVTFEDLMPQGQELIGSLQQVAQAARDIMADPEFVKSMKQTMNDIAAIAEATRRLVDAPEFGQGLKDTVTNVSAITASVRDLVADPEVSGSLRNTAVNVAQLTARADKVMQDVQRVTSDMDSLTRTMQNVEGITADGRKQIATLMESVNEAARNVAETTEAVAWLVKDGQATAHIREGIAAMSRSAANIEQVTKDVAGLTGDQQVQTDLKAILASLARTADNLEASTAAMRKVVTDEETQARVKSTLAATEQTMVHASAVAEDLSSFLQKTGGVMNRVAGWEVGFDSMYRYLPGPNRFFGDLGVTITPAERSFVYLGVHDITESNDLELMAGARLSPRSQVRFGLNRGKLGVGLDHAPIPRLGLRLDLFDPNHVTLNTWAQYQMSSRLAIMAGLEDVGRETHVGLGVRYQLSH